MKEDLLEALAEQVQRCISSDGAQAVIIGGGPLGAGCGSHAAALGTPVIAPIPAAVERRIGLLQARPEGAFIA